MKTGRLHLRVDPKLRLEVLKICKKRKVSLTRTVEDFFRALVEEDKKKQIIDAEQV